MNLVRARSTIEQYQILRPKTAILELAVSLRPSDASASGTMTLRPTDRRNLLRALNRLSSPDPLERASAAQRASELVQRRQASWDALLLPAAVDVPGPVAETTPAAWPGPALALLERPELLPNDRDALRRVAVWKAPGQAGLALVREVEARLRGLEHVPTAGE